MKYLKLFEMDKYSDEWEDLEDEEIEDVNIGEKVRNILIEKQDEIVYSVANYKRYIKLLINGINVTLEREYINNQKIINIRYTYKQKMYRETVYEYDADWDDYVALMKKLYKKQRSNVVRKQINKIKDYWEFFIADPFDERGAQEWEEGDF